MNERNDSYPLNTALRAAEALESGEVSAIALALVAIVAAISGLSDVLSDVLDAWRHPVSSLVKDQRR